MYLEIQKLCLPWCPSLRAASHRGGLFIAVKAKPLPSAEELNRYLSYCPETGSLKCREKWCSISVVGREMGYTDGRGYIYVRFKTVLYLAHRLIYRMMVPDSIDELEVDHVDEDKSNNRWKNLRAGTSSQNKYNRKHLSTNTSGYKGVTWSKRSNKWHTQVKCTRDGVSRLYTAGYFHDIHEADRAITALREKLHGAHANHGTGSILLEA